MPVVVNLDDFCEEIMTSQLWELLAEAKRWYPRLKITMFTIPLKCSSSWLRHVHQNYDWIEMHYHGSDHVNRNEWLQRPSFDFDYLDDRYYFRGFKAPWWRLDQVTADRFNDMGFLISTNRRNPLVAHRLYQYDDGKRVINDMHYRKPEYETWHGHVQSQARPQCPNPNPNGLPDCFDRFVAAFERDAEFRFVSQVVP